MNKPEIQDSIEYKEVLAGQDKEKIWSDAFGSEYKPDYDFEVFFSDLESYYFVSDRKNGSKKDKQKFDEIHSLIKKNGYKLNISFLESLSSDQKKYISSLFFKIYGKELDVKFYMGKSILIRMYWWWQSDIGRSLDSETKLYAISKNFEGFNFNYFRQAWDCIRQTGDKNIYNIICEYNLLVNIDKDVKSLEINETSRLGEDFSLGVLHTRSEEIGYGPDEKYGVYELDHNGNEKNFISRGVKRKLVKTKFNGFDYVTVLDRNDKSIYEDASGKEYDIFIDSPAGLALFYHGLPIACISFYIKGGNEIFINQIQKLAYYEYDRYGRCIGRHYSSVLEFIDRKNYIYDAIIQLAKKHNISQITIQGAKNNKWVKKPLEDTETYYFKSCVKAYLDKSLERKCDKKFHLSKEYAHKIYDVFAEKNGFKIDEHGNRKTKI